MIRHLLCLLLATSTIALVSPFHRASAAEFTPLFDGKSFDGWEGDKSVFRIEEGAIVGGSTKAPVARNEFLATTKEYGDFELKLKFKVLGKGANAGVQIRSRRIPDHHEMKGYQADLGEGWYGSLYDESRRNRILKAADPEKIAKLVKPEEWNDYHIRCQDKHIVLAINGETTVDYTEEESDIEARGLIAVQIHGGPPSEAWYKDIEIRELSSK